MTIDKEREQLTHTMCTAALAYAAKGYAVIHVPYGSKKITRDNWTEERYSREELQEIFSEQPWNSGLLLGDPSAGLVDVDLDHPEAVAAADQFLPPTPAVFGRPGKLRSHRIYRCAKSPKTKQYKSKAGPMIVELRSTGAQTIFPPSQHDSGEQIAWELDASEPVQVDPEKLKKAVYELARFVKEKLGEVAPKGKGKSKSKEKGKSKDKVELCRKLLAEDDGNDNKDGSSRLYRCACRCVEHDLNDTDALSLINEVQRNKPFPETWSDEDILTRIRDAEKVCTRGVALGKRKRRRDTTTDGGGGRGEVVEVEITTEEYMINDSVAASLQHDERLYQRGGSLVRVQSEPLKPNSPILVPRIVPLEPASLREQITRHVAFTKRDKRGELNDAHPPGWCVQAVHARGEWEGVPRLTGLVEHPVLRSDGSILARPGYDPETGYFLISGTAWPTFQNHYTRDDGVKAAKLLMDMVADFPFKNDVHRASWLAALLTVLCRQAFNGPAPLFLVDSNTRGSGKGLLCDTISLIATGRRFPTAAYTSDQAELQKQITATVLQGDMLVLFDNVEGFLGNGTLDRALTSTVWRGRVLGESREVELPLQTTFFATGNNVHPRADTPRRICHIRLETSHENPEDRADFQHADLRGWVLENRPLLLHAALSIVAAYAKAGRPSQNLTPWGSYEAWSSWVRGCVVWVGYKDPADSREAIRRQGDTDAQAMVCILSHWHILDPDNRGITAQELLKRLDTNQDNEDWAELCDGVDQLINRRVPRDLGTKFRHFARRVFGGVYLDLGTKVRGVNRWCLYHAEGRLLRRSELAGGYMQEVGHVFPPEPAMKSQNAISLEVPPATEDASVPRGEAWESGPEIKLIDGREVALF